MLKYVQAQVPIPLFKRLKVEALERDIGLGDLLNEILEDWDKKRSQELKHQNEGGFKNGSKKVEKRSEREGKGKNNSS